MATREIFKLDTENLTIDNDFIPWKFAPERVKEYMLNYAQKCVYKQYTPTTVTLTMHPGFVWFNTYNFLHPVRVDYGEALIRAVKQVTKRPFVIGFYRNAIVVNFIISDGIETRDPIPVAAFTQEKTQATTTPVVTQEAPTNPIVTHEANP